MSARHTPSNTRNQVALLPNLWHKNLIILLLVLVHSSFGLALETDGVSKQPLVSKLSEKNNLWSSVKPYVAKYDFLLDDDKLGHATRTLTNKNNQWRMETTVKAKKFILHVNSKETSEFHIDDLQIVNDKFSSYSKITFKKTKVIKQIFDWCKKIETGNRNKQTWVLPLESQVFDRVSHLVQLRVDLLQGLKNFDYPVSHKGAVHRYIYKLEKKEILDTGFGKVSAHKFVREKSGNEIFIVWLAPEFNYFPVKISQYKEDKPRVTLLLNSLNIEHLGNSQDGTTFTP